MLVLKYLTLEFLSEFIYLNVLIQFSHLLFIKLQDYHIHADVDLRTLMEK